MNSIWSHLVVPGVPILEKVIRTLVVYGFLLLGLRLAGKRELGQFNPFDLVVLLLLSNTVQNAMIGNDDSVLGGLVGALVLLGANYLLVRFLYRHPEIDRIVEGEADVLIRDGVIVEENLKRELITPPELMAAARRQGIERLEEVACCRIEVGGALTFIPMAPTDQMRRHDELLQRLTALENRLKALAGER
ncbi:MAG: DUF421 domain-containing protein [Gemmatimonadota bacterium]|nr:DUF421 domain-containing protein [Gemmatimonadota bacterium]